MLHKLNKFYVVFKKIVLAFFIFIPVYLFIISKIVLSPPMLRLDYKCPCMRWKKTIKTSIMWAKYISYGSEREIIKSSLTEKNLIFLEKFRIFYKRFTTYSVWASFIMFLIYILYPVYFMSLLYWSGILSISLGIVELILIPLNDDIIVLFQKHLIRLSTTPNSQMIKSICNDNIQSRFIFYHFIFLFLFGLIILSFKRKLVKKVKS